MLLRTTGNLEWTSSYDPLLHAPILPLGLWKRNETSHYAPDNSMFLLPAGLMLFKALCFGKTLGCDVCSHAPHRPLGGWEGGAYGVIMLLIGNILMLPARFKLLLPSCTHKVERLLEGRGGCGGVDGVVVVRLVGLGWW